MKRALVLSGGGAKGGFQYGALRYIMENEVNGMLPGDYFSLISGVSVGALNGVMMAQNRYEALTRLWRNISGNDVYRGNLGLLRILWRMVTNKLGILSNEPLQELIRNNVSLAAVEAAGCDFMFGSVSVETGLYYSFHARDFRDEDQFREGVLASSAMPVIWPPVKSIVTETGAVYRQLVDGGIRNVSPLGDVINYGPDEVVIINCNAEDFQPYPDPARNMLKIAIRALTEITINEIFRQDIREFLHINRIISQLPPGVVVKRKDGTPFKKYRSILIEPTHDLGDALDFNREKINLHIEEGYEAARLAYENAETPGFRRG